MSITDEFWRGFWHGMKNFDENLAWGFIIAFAVFFIAIGVGILRGARTPTPPPRRKKTGGEASPL